MESRPLKGIHCNVFECESLGNGFSDLSRSKVRKLSKQHGKRNTPHRETNKNNQAKYVLIGMIF